MNTFEWLTANKDLIQSISSAVAILTAFLSILLTAITLGITRKHNIVSLKPIANFSIADYESKISVRIFNRGTGPLIITSFKATKGNESKHNIIDWMPNNILWTTFFDDPQGFTISPLQSLNLIEYSVESPNKKEAQVRDKIRHALAKLIVQIEYTDIYGNQMPISTRSLSWFGRHFINTTPSKRKKLS